MYSYSTPSNSGRIKGYLYLTAQYKNKGVFAWTISYPAQDNVLVNSILSASFCYITDHPRTAKLSSIDSYFPVVGLIEWLL